MRVNPPLPAGPLGSFRRTATVMRYIATNAVHVNGAVRFP